MASAFNIGVQMELAKGPAAVTEVSCPAGQWTPLVAASPTAQGSQRRVVLMANYDATKTLLIHNDNTKVTDGTKGFPVFPSSYYPDGRSSSAWYGMGVGGTVDVRVITIVEG